jgi:hypothetical protein
MKNEYCVNVKVSMFLLKESFNLVSFISQLLSARRNRCRS